ncbi:MAG: helix-turn-helix transcriptional regulator [Bacteroidaceae bacterium]|nr:helix-turn-helix transcriptional regulator [Bacteroidaceae bacterium]
MKDRIKLLMDAQHMTQSGFSAMLGLNPATLSQLLTGKANPSLNHVEAIRKGFPNISYEWLIAGTGPMYKVEAQPTNSGGNQEQELFTEDGQANVATQLQQQVKNVELVRQTPIVEPAPSKEVVQRVAKEPTRKVKEITIYYTDQTFETFVPKEK